MRFKIHLFLIALLAFIGTLSVPAGAAHPPVQNTEKSLDIERYPNEPLELLDIKIGGQSLLTDVKTKSRRNGEGLDEVKFRGEDRWFKHINVRLRNVSGKTIKGMRGRLYFTPPGARNMFVLPLSYMQRANPRGRLMPGEEVELVVDDKVFDTTMEIFRQHGADADIAAVTLSIESALFSDEIQWYRGNLLKQDPGNPLRWVPIKPT